MITAAGKGLSELAIFLALLHPSVGMTPIRLSSPFVKIFHQESVSRNEFLAKNFQLQKHETMNILKNFWIISMRITN